MLCIHVFYGYVYLPYFNHNHVLLNVTYSPVRVTISHPLLAAIPEIFELLCDICMLDYSLLIANLNIAVGWPTDETLKSLIFVQNVIFKQIIPKNLMI